MRAFILLLFVVSVSAQAKLPLVAETTYAEIKRLSLEIVKMCPPKNCLVIGIGRSPIAITTFLDQVKPGSAINLPLSEFRNDFLTTAERKSVFDYFDRFLKDKIPAHVERVLLIDYSQKGESIYAADKYFKEYVNYKRMNQKVDSAILYVFDHEERIYKTLKINDYHPYMLRVQDTSDYFIKLESQFYDDYAEYGAYNLNGMKKGVDPFKNGRLYPEFQEHIRSFIKSDARLVSEYSKAQGVISIPAPVITPTDCFKVKLRKIFRL